MRRIGKTSRKRKLENAFFSRKFNNTTSAPQSAGISQPKPGQILSACSFPACRNLSLEYFRKSHQSTCGGEGEEMDLNFEIDSVWGHLGNSARYERLEIFRLATRTVCDPTSEMSGTG